MNSSLLIGNTKVDITPTRSIPLAGFKNRTAPFIDVAHRLYAKVIWFRSETEGSPSVDAVLISADLIWWSSDLTERLLARIEKQFGVPSSHIILHATHNHGGPQTSKLFLSSLGIADEQYLLQLEKSIIDGVDTAVRLLEPVQIRRGSADCRIGIHRRRMDSGKMNMAPNPDGPVDPEVVTISFTRLDGSVKAVLVHYACHPTTTFENRVTAEYPGIAMDQMERALGDQAIAVFLQGCCADIRPNLQKDGLFYRGTDDDVQRLGAELAISALRAHHSAGMEGNPCPIEVRTIQIGLPLRTALEDSSWTEGELIDEADRQEWRSVHLARANPAEREIILDMGMIRLASNLGLVVMNGELAVEYGLMIKQLKDGFLLPLPYSNGMIGYVPTADQVTEGGYEAVESALFFGLPSPFDLSLESKIKKALHQLIN
jgi:hypothetical protein